MDKPVLFDRSKTVSFIFDNNSIQEANRNEFEFQLSERYHISLALRTKNCVFKRLNLIWKCEKVENVGDHFSVLIFMLIEHFFRFNNFEESDNFMVWICYLNVGSILKRPLAIQINFAIKSQISDKIIIFGSGHHEHWSILWTMYQSVHKNFRAHKKVVIVVENQI